jgi:hypothetical protein
MPDEQRNARADGHAPQPGVTTGGMNPAAGAAEAR